VQKIFCTAPPNGVLKTKSGLKSGYQKFRWFKKTAGWKNKADESVGKR